MSLLLYTFFCAELSFQTAWVICENSLYMKLTLPAILNGHSVSSIHHREVFYTYKHCVYLSSCLLSVSLCFAKAPDHGVLPVILCNHEGRETVQQFFSYFVLNAYQHRCCCSYLASQLHSGIVTQHYNTIFHSYTQTLLSFTVSKQDMTLLCYWNLCSLWILSPAVAFLASFKQQLKKFKQPSELHSNWLAKVLY